MTSAQLNFLPPSPTTEPAPVMKAIALWQPWASLWCSCRKVHETRGWPTDYRGWVLVHATKKFVRDVSNELDEILTDEFGPHWGLELDTGALIGAVNIIACKPTEDVFREQLAGRRAWAPEEREDYQCGDFTSGRFAFERSEWKRFERPVPTIGRQAKFFDIPSELVQPQWKAEAIS